MRSLRAVVFVTPIGGCGWGHRWGGSGVPRSGFCRDFKPIGVLVLPVLLM